MSISRLPSGWISVTCTHGDRVAKVQDFAAIIDGKNVSWDALEEVNVGHDGLPVDGEPQTDEHFAMIDHTKYEFYCKICGANYKWRRESVDPILTTLAQNGIGHLELNNLAAIIELGRR